ncbi:MAG: protein kinase [candidate division KSB1 bacterium]|nr:protein kinase [candidate division KSB1 bacterium]MDZ7273643.1 protein kinase [candidate division KSB1 bacterium]MDZ7286766.1 protein kinase [candidate division KSB1 bacterium]MDZ7299877.1 protein kinase [candidate division KSB1 bacterium]MDZ7305814.1 protein kinase [candidate division KSB1 bacterium]
MTNLPPQASRLIAILQTLAEAYYSRGQYAEAIEKLEQLRQAGAESPEIFHKLALAHLARRDYSPAAKAAYARAFELFPHEEGLCLKLCQLLLAQHVRDEFSFRVYQRALAFQPPFEKEIYQAFFVYFHSQNQLPHAYEALKQVVQLERGREADNLSRLQQLAWQLGRESEAESLLERLAAVSPHRELIHRLLGVITAMRIHREPEGVAYPPAAAQIINRALAAHGRLNSISLVREFCRLQHALRLIESRLLDQQSATPLPASPPLIEPANASEAGVPLTAAGLAGELFSRLASDLGMDASRLQLPGATLRVLVLQIDNLEKIAQQTSPQLAENLAGRFLNFSAKFLGKAVAAVCFTLSDGLIAVAGESLPLAQAGVALLHKIENYNFSVPEVSRLAVSMVVHAVPPEAASAAQALAALHLALNLLVARSTAAGQTQPAGSSRLLLERGFYERELNPDAVAARPGGTYVSELPGFRVEAYEAVWYNPLDYVDEKRSHPLGKFLVLERLRHNGFAGTYRGRDRQLERRVILKALSPQRSLQLSKDRSLREEMIKTLQRLGRLEQPGLALLYDLGFQDGLFYYVREYLEGSSLAQSLANKGRFSPFETSAIGIKICRVLLQTHRQNIVHGNLKPSNIWLMANGELKITDFFVPEFVETPAPGKRLSGTSWRYRAPEWLLHGTLAPAGDIYAIGMILYELVTGEPPFAKQEELASPADIHQLPPPSLAALQAEIPGILVSIIERAGDRSLLRRFKSLEELEAALQVALEQSLQREQPAAPATSSHSLFSFRRMLKSRNE